MDDRGQKRLREYEGNEEGRSSPISLSHPISPPRKKTRLPGATTTPALEPQSSRPARHKSPFQLTRIRDVDHALNHDTVTLDDILGDPLIAECWNFNYLHDIDYLMKHFDRDVRGLVNVHVVHGFWKKEDENRLHLQQVAEAYKNVTLHAAFLPEMFGTHHSKMLILLRHDDTAQVIIHTANMISRDWTNMTQAVWRSPLLPLLSTPSPGDSRARIGTGAKFKGDLLNYLRAYDGRRVTCGRVADALMKYDFSAVQGALIASTPGRHNTLDDSPTTWGWHGLKQALRAVKVQEGKAEVVVQISSIATLGPTTKWLRETFFTALSSRAPMALGAPKPEFKIVFPTADEIRSSLDGYFSGHSIHTKIASAQQEKQLQYLKPMLCHWANDSPKGTEPPQDEVVRDGGRQRAAPHIKTYIRYGPDKKSIDWALTTSANLSKQAWGDNATSSGEMRISSYEIGVLVWPALYEDDAVMVPTFGKDEPDTDDKEFEGRTIIGLRIPYSLPLQPYGKSEIPWVATASYDEPDWKGQIWGGY